MPENTLNTQSPDEELEFQTQVITTVIKIAIVGAALFLADSLIVYYKKEQPQSLIASSIGAALLLVGFYSLWLIQRGKFQLAKRVFLAAYFIRSVQVMMVIPENLFPISIMYMTGFVVLGIFLSEPKRGFLWIVLGVASSIAIILIRPFTRFPLTAIPDPLTHALALYFLPLVCLSIISTLCVYIYRQFHKTLLESLDARRRLKRSNKTLEHFAYVASHDLQEPLRTITCYAQLLESDYKGKIEKGADDYIQSIVDGAKRMHQLTNDLLQYSRLKTQVVSFQPTNLNEIMVQVLKNLRFVIEESNAILETDDLPTVNAHPSQMTRLFQNLLVNALKFHSEQPPRIKISAKRRDKHWLFSVKDNGIGIKPEYSEKIFQIFQRLHSRDKYPGTGIGLAIAQETIKAHGGRIWVESEFGKGSTFFFTLAVLNSPKNIEKPADYP